MSNQAPTPVPAATILMLREREALEVFMVVRHHQIDFASGALVFPGGKADAQDFDDALLPYLQGAAAETDMRAIQVCAIREAFEECGILLAYRGDKLISGAELEPLEPYREKLNSGETALLDFLRDHELRLACDQLVHFAHWITPEMMPKRFDTHFYLAVAPEDHLAIHDGYESVDSVWIKPGDAVADAEAGRRTIIFPTLKNVEKLATFGNIQAAVEETQAGSVVPVLPWTEKREDGNYICIPPEAGYEGNSERIPDRA